MKRRKDTKQPRDTQQGNHYCACLDAESVKKKRNDRETNNNKKQKTEQYKNKIRRNNKQAVLFVVIIVFIVVHVLVLIFRSLTFIITLTLSDDFLELAVFRTFLLQLWPELTS